MTKSSLRSPLVDTLSQVGVDALQGLIDGIWFAPQLLGDLSSTQAFEVTKPGDFAGMTSQTFHAVSKRISPRVDISGAAALKLSIHQIQD
jgi:hypothetical protein